MNLIRYQAPELAPWSAADRWSNLRDELNSFFELPLWSSFARGGQLFTGWSPASIFTRAMTMSSPWSSCPECARKTSKFLCMTGH